MCAKGVLCGLRFKKNFPQTKLVREVEDSVFDVAVDLRFGSDTYGKWYDIELNEEKRNCSSLRESLYMVFGVSEITDFCYKCGDF